VQKEALIPLVHLWAPTGSGALYLMNPIQKTFFFGIFLLKTNDFAILIFFR
jgi:hypothetical protein